MPSESEDQAEYQGPQHNFRLILEFSKSDREERRDRTDSQTVIQIYPKRGLATPRFNQPSPVTFTLKGIPGLEDLYLWLSLPFSYMFVAILLGNSTILFLLAMESALDKPMYHLLAMLLLADQVSTLAMMPRVLSLLWFGIQDISQDACLLQMFFIHAVLTGSLVCRLGRMALDKGMVLFLPILLLLRELTFCRTVIAHTYCYHMAVVKMACGHSRPNRIYSLFVAVVVVGLDCLLIGASYALILRAVLQLSFRGACLCALSTCSSHLSVVLIIYGPGLFSALVQHFDHSMLIHIHILLAKLYLPITSLFNPVIFWVLIKHPALPASLESYNRSLDNCRWGT
ncbi:putative olfactory receptor 52P1 [Tachyglossus aculeatus]|uniref:putative olfactory receptor 52P1 n=1 Tax=Tachyglossus aculeatus TaxID=9261 RepID=UPI0018F3D6D6|nr:putative olfactory receptor 52P1 [Tachyglossus aculeatus]